MSDLELLFLVLAVVYGWECASWIGRDSTAFRTWLGRQWRTVQPGTLIGNQRGGFIFAPPLPPLGTLVVGQQFPFSLSPQGVDLSGESGKVFRFDEIRSIETKGRKVYADGVVMLKASSSTLAEYLGQQLERLSKLPSPKRANAIENIVRHSLDTDAAKRRWLEVQREIAKLRWPTNLLFVYLFVLAPLLIWNFGLRRCWLGLLIGVLAFTITTAVRFRSAHKALYPAAEDERFTHFLTILLSPATTIRAHDVLSRPALEIFHPLAIAKVFCPEETFLELARQTLRELRYPVLPVRTAAEPMALETERDWRALQLKTIEAFLERTGNAPETILAPPMPTDPACHSYCPRCLAQFTASEGLCPDCGGVALVPFKPEITPARSYLAGS
jgi:hypothetical protein